MSEIDRKALKRPDKFLVILQDFATFLSKNKRALAFAGVVAVLGFGGWSYWTDRGTHEETLAQDQLFSARQVYEGEHQNFLSLHKKPEAAPKLKKGKANEPPPPPEASGGERSWEYASIDVPKTYAKTLVAYEDVIKKFPKSRAAFLAAMEAGNLHFNHGSILEAQKFFNEAAQKAKWPLEKAIAISNLAYCEEDLKNYSQAIETFSRALREGEGELKGELLTGIARNQNLLGKPDEAQKTYDQIIKDLPNTPYAKAAESLKNMKRNSP